MLTIVTIQADRETKKKAKLEAMEEPARRCLICKTVLFICTCQVVKTHRIKNHSETLLYFCSLGIKKVYIIVTGSYLLNECVSIT